MSTGKPRGYQPLEAFPEPASVGKLPPRAGAPEVPPPRPAATLDDLLRDQQNGTQALLAAMQRQELYLYGIRFCLRSLSLVVAIGVGLFLVGIAMISVAGSR